MPTNPVHAERGVDAESHVPLRHEDGLVLGVVAPRAQPEIGADRAAVIRSQPFLKHAHAASAFSTVILLYSIG